MSRYFRWLKSDRSTQESGGAHQAPAFSDIWRTTDNFLAYTFQSVPQARNEIQVGSPAEPR
ncbi:hypothetical protein G3M48_003518 [Beauveria asiatica]|uniref:Uncharacterized protein n=1 Tax=Beauveria asiatica TaxID=1069075 RepID=A0AAW0S7F9_9HYPO